MIVSCVCGGTQGREGESVATHDQWLHTHTPGVSVLRSLSRCEESILEWLEDALLASGE